MVSGLPPKIFSRVPKPVLVQTRPVQSILGASTKPLSSRQTRWATVDATKGAKEKVVILGSGWAGFVFSRNLDPKKYQPLIVSPRSYFVFTPLLNEATVGTTEFRSILEPVRSKHSTVELFQGWADAIDFEKKTIRVEESIFDPSVTRAIVPDNKADGQILKAKGQTFEVSYDKLIIAVGCHSQTFGTKGVKEHAMFLKDVGDGRKIRRRVLELFEIAGLPSFTDDVRKCLLHFAIVGGGPTGVEFAAELRDLIHEDLKKLYPDLIKFVRISVYDVAPKVLPMFDKTLATYAMETLGKDGIQIKTSHRVEELRQGLPSHMPKGLVSQDGRKGGCYTLKTAEEGEVGIGMCVWSTGNTQNSFLKKAFGKPIKFPAESAIIKGQPQAFSERSTSNTNRSLDPAKQDWVVSRDVKKGSLIVTDRFQLQLETAPEGHGSSTSPQLHAVMPDVYALGDCATITNNPLPATAQVANQEARWLAKHFNRGDVGDHSFTYKELGVMTYLGNSRAMLQKGSANNVSATEGGKTKPFVLEFKGRQAYWLWRAAYLSMVISWRNRLLVWTHWFVAKSFGRDITRF